MTPWFKFIVSYWGEIRNLRLRRTIGDAALWLPIRLWSFAVTQDRSDGDLSGYRADELAAELQYRGDADAMLRALIDCGYLDSSMKVIGWDEMYGLPASRKAAARARVAHRWAKRKTPPAPPQSEDKRRVRIEGDVIPDVLPHVEGSTRTPWPDGLTPDQAAAIRTKLGRLDVSVDAILAVYPSTRDRERKYNAPFDDRALSTLCADAATVRIPAPAARPAAPAAIPEPPAWRETIQNEDDLRWAAGRDWPALAPTYQAQIVRRCAAATTTEANA